jgi:hypothetical protein
MGAAHWVVAVLEISAATMDSLEWKA